MPQGGPYGYYGSMQGIPLIATPPEGGDPGPHTISHYQPNWKAFADFSVLEQLDPANPQLRQLMQQVSFSILAAIQ